MEVKQVHRGWRRKMLGARARAFESGMSAMPTAQDLDIWNQDKDP